MGATFCARSVNDRAILRVLRQHLTLENPAVFQGEVKDVALCSLWHGIKPYDRGWSMNRLQTVPDASEVPVSTVQPAHALKRLGLRHDLHLPELRCK
jgi:hypothetical protein